MDPDGSIFAQVGHNLIFKEFASGVHGPTNITAVSSGGYVTSQSSAYSNDATSWGVWKLFDCNSSSMWYTEPTVELYSTSTGAYLGTSSLVVDGTEHKDAWVRLQFPAATSLFAYTIRPSGAFSARAPTSFIVAVSSDGVTYTMWDNRTVQDWPNATTQTFTPSSPANSVLFVQLVCKT
eukprot:g74502.t1